MTSRPVLFGEELPRGSLNPGDSYKKVGIMAGIIGRSILNGGRKPAHGFKTDNDMAIYLYAICVPDFRNVLGRTVCPNGTAWCRSVRLK